MRTIIHGIKSKTLDEVLVSGSAFKGWSQARAEHWKYIDEHTILIGHSLHNDLEVLRMLHHRVVATAILIMHAVGIPNHQQGLSLVKGTAWF